ncbi:portal protein [Martelella mediterranea]|uniref:Head-to-tail connecting protein n=1 Tax=Martelella mediterranea TaxID=293089 RepID=A0A4R3NI53_9HYPH|nr:portal protein [Martelella mediterranea]TCT34643.1 head-to-tail connecting protein [Martelella mediterranea]
MSETTRLKQRRNVAQRERDEFQPLLDEAYQYAIPFRKSANSERNGRSRGEKRVDQVFDHTAVDSAFRFAGKLQQDFWPAGQDNFKLEPGPVIVNPAERDELAKQLEPIGSVAGAFFDDGDWDMAFHEMALELSAGTGAILMDSTNEPDKLWEPMSVPIDELLLENGPRNRISGIFWTRKMTIRVVKETWPRARLSEEMKELLRDKPEEEIDIYQDTVYDARKSEWIMTVWCKKQSAKLRQKKSRTCPWLVPRYFRVPGETYGRGPVMLAMPTIKTLNTTARLQLQAASIAMLGIYTAVDDGVFNPDLAVQAPGAFWKVARNGGSLGPSVQRFPDPRIDLQNMVLNEMRMGVKATMMDQSLPAEGAAVRSATEILERVKRLASDHLGAYGRLVKEVTIPAVKRVLELAYNRGLIASDIPIDQLLVRVKIKSPLAIAREAQRIEKIVQWLQMVLMIMQDRSNRVAKVEQSLVMIGRDFGIPEKLMVTDKERDAMDEQEQQLQAAAVAAQAAGAAGGS